MKKIIAYFRINDPTLAIEDRVFVIVCTILVMISCIAVVMNTVLGLPYQLNIVILFIAFLYFLMLQRALSGRITTWLRVNFILVGMVSLFCGYFLNGGLIGAMIPFLSIALIFALFSVSRNKHKLITILFIAELLLMVGVESLYPDLVIGYENENMQFLDLATTFIMVIFFTGVLISAFKASYEKEREYLLEIKAELEESKAKIEEAMEEVQRATRSKSMFLANMSHELRTPLNGIIGIGDLLRHTDSKEEQLELIETLNSSGELLLNIISDILDISKIEAGKMELFNQPVNLKTTIETIANFTVLRVKETKPTVEFKYKIDPDVKFGIICDESRLKQILLNLLSNAIKFTSSGSIFLHVSLVQSNQSSQVIRFSIQDTGIGIEEALLPLLFNPFYQIDSGTSKKYAGTGLGLSICKNLCDQMKGEISAQSTLGVGSTFTFELPFETYELSHEGNLQMNSAQDFSAEGQLKILVAEDNKMNQIIASKIFDNLGVKVHMANDGKEALEAFKREVYDVIFMDIQMPVMDGLKATTEIRKLVNFTQPVIIAVTANAMKEDETACYAAGMNHFISKPITIKKVREMMTLLVGSGIVN